MNPSAGPGGMMGPMAGPVPQGGDGGGGGGGGGAPPLQDEAGAVCAEPKVFVGSLRFEVTQEEVQAHYAHYGALRSAVLLKHLDSGKSKGCAMVLFERWGDAEKAVAAENGTQTQLTAPRTAVVKFADPQCNEQGVLCGVTPKKLFIGQVPGNTALDQIQAIFAPYGTMLDANIMPPRKPGQMGCAFVTYGTWADAEAALLAVNGSITLPGSQHPLAVKFADAKPAELAKFDNRGTKRGAWEMGGMAVGGKRQMMGAKGGVGPMGMGPMGMMNPAMMGMMGPMGMMNPMMSAMMNPMMMNMMSGMGGMGMGAMGGPMGGMGSTGMGMGRAGPGMVGGGGGMAMQGGGMMPPQGGGMQQQGGGMQGNAMQGGAPMGMGTGAMQHGGVGMQGGPGDGLQQGSMQQGGGMVMGGAGGDGVLAGTLMGGGMQGSMMPPPQPQPQMGYDGSMGMGDGSMQGGMQGGGGGMPGGGGMQGGMQGNGAMQGGMQGGGMQQQGGGMGAMGGGMGAMGGGMGAMGGGMGAMGGGMGAMGGGDMMGMGMGPMAMGMGPMGMMNPMMNPMMMGMGMMPGMMAGMMGGMMGSGASGGGGGGSAAATMLNAAKQWKLFVGQISFDLDEEALTPFFAQWGTILELAMPRTDGRPRGYAFLTYSSQAEAEAAIVGANGAIVPNDPRQRPLQVRYASVKGV